ncbi:unnamed protein product [Trichobilharzia szidati]|nr:unnamed protein product [Trichobilharzia szidati]
MSNYFTVDGEVDVYPRPRFAAPIDENQDNISESKFVTNAHLGRITFNRPIADWDSLMSKNDNGGGDGDADGDGRSTKNRRRNCFKSLFCCSRQQYKSYSLYCLLTVFPCINTLLNYNWRSDFLKDVSGGLTIGILNIPQGKCHLLFV